MPDVIDALSDDEFSVLCIAAEGESMIDLGEFSRWSAPIQSLVRRGYMLRQDRHNNVITPAGRAALAVREKDEDKLIGRAIDVSNQIGAAQSKIRDMASQMVDVLIAIGVASNKVTGEDARLAARKWGAIVVDEAVKKMQE